MFTAIRAAKSRKESLGLVIVTFAALACLAGEAVAQQRQPAPTKGVPQLYIVMPPGCKAGTSVEVTLSGQDLEEAEALLFSHPGIKAEIVHDAPLPEPKKPEPKRGQGKRPANQMATTATARFKVTIPGDTPIGSHDVRVITKTGISNPRAFVVGDLAEVLEKEPNNDVGQAQRVELNTTVSGSIATPTDVDYYVFAGKKGQRVLAYCLASSIDSRMNPAIEMYNRDGKLLAFNRNYRGFDALVDCTLPADGDYTIRLYEFTYTQGGPEYFYRLTISTTPWIDAIYPPVVEPGKATTVTVYGRNLPGGKLDPEAVVDERVLEKITTTVNAPGGAAALQRLNYRGRVAPPASALDGFEFRVRNAAGTSNPYLLTFARAPVVLDNAQNNTPETAQEVSVPCEIAGRIEKKRDRDWYTFSANKGDVFTIEAFGDRIGSAIDLYIVLRDANAKKPLMELDDNPDTMNPVQFYTRTEDPPYYRFVAPADGKYQLMVATREATIQAGPRDLYRVRIAPEKPDFRLVAMPQALSFPDACVLHQGGRIYYTVYAWRFDGFDGPIEVKAEGLPEGVTCPPQTIGPNTREASLVLIADKSAPAWNGAITIKGTAKVDEETLVREARPATITWPAPQNVAAITRLDQSLVLAVRDAAPFTITAKTATLSASPGQTVTIPVKIERQKDFKLPIQVAVLSQPNGQKQKGRRQQQFMTIAADKTEGNATLNVPNDAMPGTYTIVVRGDAQTAPTRKGKGRPQNAMIVQATEPITLTVESKSAAKLSVSPAKLGIKAGKQAELVVAVNRKELTGKCRVEVVFPSRSKGLSAEQVVLNGKQNEAKLVVKAAADTRPGDQPNIVIRATGTGRGGATVSQETKVTITVK